MRVSLLSLILLAATTPALGQSLDIRAGRFTPSERIVTDSEWLDRKTLQTLRRVPTYKPDTTVVGNLDGVTYSYRSSGLALFANTPDADSHKMARFNSWAVECKKDAMDDSVTCSVAFADLIVAFPDKGGPLVVVGRNRYPGSGIAIRIDDQQPLSGTLGFQGDSAAAVLAKLKTARKVTTRYQEWPYRANVDRVIDLYGFVQAVQFAAWAHARFR